MLGKFIARDFIAIAGEMRRFPASNENTAQARCTQYKLHYVIKFVSDLWQVGGFLRVLTTMK